MPRSADQSRAISSAKRAGRAAQCATSVCGCMSAMLTMAPLASMKATDSGNGVFFIHMQCTAAASNTNSMPPFGASAATKLHPRAELPRGQRRLLGGGRAGGEEQYG